MKAESRALPLSLVAAWVALAVTHAVLAGAVWSGATLLDPSRAAVTGVARAVAWFLVLGGSGLLPVALGATVAFGVWGRRPWARGAVVALALLGLPTAAAPIGLALLAWTWASRETGEARRGEPGAGRQVEPEDAGEHTQELVG